MKNRQPTTEQKKVFYSFEQLLKDVDIIINILKERNVHIECIYGIPRGGLVLGSILSNKLNVPLFLDLKGDINKYSYKSILIVDDISDKGDTFKGIPNIDKMNTVSLFIKEHTKFVPDIYCHKEKTHNWIIFPWE